MVTLRVLRDGKEFKKLSLESGRTYLAGRAETCDIVLNESSISRQHLKFFNENGKWKVQMVSRFGHITHLDTPHQTLDLENGIRFYTEDFEFRFDEVFATHKNTAPILNFPKIPVSPGTIENLELEEPEEKTSIGFVTAIPFVRIVNSKTQKSKDIKLDGSSWKAGRAPDCQIEFDESAASRIHFEIFRSGEGFQLKDLGSSNGTRLNGELLDEQKPVLLISGDIISIGATTIEFQVRDPQFSVKFQQYGLVPVEIPTGRNKQLNQNVEIVKRLKSRYKVKPMHGAIGGTVALILVLALTGEDPQGQQEVNSEAPETNSRSTGPKITNVQKKYIEDTYNLAENLFKQQRYESSLIEIRKLHAIVPEFRRSREIETLAQQAIEIRIEQDEDMRKREEVEKLRSSARQIVSECRARRYKTVAQVQACLQPATENDPENPEAQALLVSVQRDEESRENNRANEAALKAEVQELANLYKKASNQEQSGQLLNAQSTFRQLASLESPDPKGYKQKAKDKVKQLSDQIQTEIKNAQRRANELVSQQKFKEAINELRRALDLDPEHQQAKAQFDRVYKELNKRLKGIYGDSVLEESLGNVEAAKQKWNSILEMDIQTGEYYQKAKRMLKKYGG